jgi:hypothetical protein
MEKVLIFLVKSMAFFILKGEIFLKKQDFKRQLAAIMALAVTFSSVPPVWADEISFITDDDITLNSISTIGMETNAYDLLSDPVSDCPFIITGSADSAVPLEHYYALGSEAVGSQKLVFYVNSNGAEDFKITSVTYNEADATSKLYGLIKLEEVNGVSKYAYDVDCWGTAVITVNATVGDVSYSQSFTFTSAAAYLIPKIYAYSTISIPFGTTADNIGTVIDENELVQVSFSNKYQSDITVGSEIVKGSEDDFPVPMHGMYYTLDAKISDTDPYSVDVSIVPTEEGALCYCFDTENTSATIPFDVESPIFKDAPEELVVPVFKRDTESLYKRANERAGSAAILSNKFGIYNGDTYITSSRAHTLNRYDKTYSEILATRDYVHAYGIKGYYPEAANWIFPKGYNDTNPTASTYDPSVENYGFMMNLPIRYDVKKIILKPLLDGKFTADNPIDTSNGESLSEAIKSALTFTTENMDYSNMPTELLYGNTSYKKTNVEEPEGETVYAPASDDFDIIAGDMTYDEKTGLQKVNVTFVLTEKGEEAYELSASDNAGISATVYVKAAMESYSFSKESVSVSENASEKLDLSRYLEVSPTGTDASSVKYYSDNPEIATVDESTGAVTPVAPGSAKIYARGIIGGEQGPKAYITVNVLDEITISFPNAEKNNSAYYLYVTKYEKTDSDETDQDFKYYNNIVKNNAVVTGNAKEYDFTDYYLDTRGFSLGALFSGNSMLFSFSPIENSTCLSSDSVKRLRVYAKRDAHPVLDTLTVPKDPEKANEYIKDYFDNLSFTTYTGEAIDVDYTVKSITLNNDSTATAVIEVADSQKDEICIARTEDYNKPLSTAEITVPVEYVEKQTISAHWNGGKLKLNLNTFNRDGMMAAIEEKMADDAVSFTDGSGKKIAIPFCGKDGDSGYYIVTTGAGDSMLLTLGFKGKYADFYDLDEGDVAGTVYTGQNFNVLVDFNVHIVPSFIDTDIKVKIRKTSTDAEKIAAVKEAVKAVDIRDITTGEIIDKYPYELSFGDNDIDIFNRTADATFNITDRRYVIGNSEAKTFQLGRQNFTFTDNGVEYTVSDRELKLKDGASTEAVIKVNPDDDVLTRLNLAKDYVAGCIDTESDSRIVDVVSSDANGSTITVSLMTNGNNEVLSSEKTTRLEFNITYRERKAVELKLEPTDVTDNVVYVMPDDDLNARIALGAERVKEMFTVTGAEELSEDDYSVNIQPYTAGEDEALFLITISLTNDDYCFKSKENTNATKTIIFTEKKPAMVSLSTFNSVTPVLSTDISDTNKDREAILKEYIKKNIMIAPAPASDKEMCTDYDLDDIEYTTEYSDNGLPASMTAKVVLHPDDYAENGYNYSLTFTPTWKIEVDTTLALKADATLTPELRIPLADMTNMTIDDALVDYMKNAFSIINGFEGCDVRITPTVTDGDQVQGEVTLILPAGGSNYCYKTKPGCIETLSFNAKVIGVSSATLALKDGMTLDPVIEVKDTDDADTRFQKAMEYINNAYTVENADCDYSIGIERRAEIDSGYAELILRVPDEYELSEDSVDTLIFNATYKVIYDYAKPEITKVTPAAETVGINWSEVRGAEKYRVYYFADGKWTLAGERTETGMYVRNLTPGKKYGFAVKALLNGEWTDVTASDIVYATTLDVKPRIIETYDEEGVIGINWTEVYAAEKYRVYYYTDGKWALAGERTEEHMLVKGLTKGKKYGFAVKALVNGKWTDVTSSDIVYVTVSNIKPVITKTFTSGKGTVGLNWSAVNGAEKYRVYYFADGKWTYAGERTELGMYVRNLTSGKKYGFAVKAYVDGQFTDVTSSDIVYVTAE